MPANYNENIELSELSCLLRDGSLFSTVEDILPEKGCFGWMPFGIVFDTIKELVGNDYYPDVSTVAASLDRKGILNAISIPSFPELRGMDALNFIRDFDADVSKVENYAYIIQEFYATRQITALLYDLKKKVDSGIRPVEILSKLDFESGKIATFIGAKALNVRESEDVVSSAIKVFSEAANGRSKYIPVGIDGWDDFVGGLYPGRTYMIVAYSNDGKSALGQNILMNISVNGVKIKDDAGNEEIIKEAGALFTLEMSSEEVVWRFVQIETGISPMRIEKAQIFENEKEPFKTAMDKISKAKILYDDSSEITLPLLRTRIRKAVAAGAKYIIIDQMEQLMVGSGGDNQAEHIRLNFISYRLKAFAKEMQVPIIIIHQKNRTNENDDTKKTHPTDVKLSQVSQAGEKACDAVLMITHKKEGQVPVETYFNWAKHRQGAKGYRQMKFEGSRIRFVDLPKEQWNKTEPDFVKTEN